MDYSRKKQCSNSQGGNSKVYAFPFIEYLDSQIVVTNNVLTSFPYNIIYDLNANNINFESEGNEDVNYNEKVSFSLNKLSENDNFKKFLQQDYRLIIKDNNNKIRLFGLKNGLKGSYKEESGTNRVDFNGYSFSFENKEESSAPYLNDLSLFNIMPIEGLLIEDGNNNNLQDGNNNEILN